jgi:hypothetical protein
MTTFTIITFSLAKLVLAIEAVENSPADSAGGALQWTERAWHEETQEPYDAAKDHGVSRRIAMQRLEKLAHQFAALDIKPTPKLLAVAWNKGFSGALNYHHRRTPAGGEYGNRVHNYFYAYLNNP